MSTITLPNIRVSSDLTIRLKLKDGGVAIDWSTLQNIRVSLYADDQRSMASRCSVSIDEEDSTILVCQYAANKMQYLGVNRVIVQCKYMGEVKTYDKPAFNFVRWTSDQEGEQITIDDPDVDVEISVEDVSSSILQEAVDAAFSAADRANEAAEEAEHMVDIHTGPAGKSPYIGENGHWYEWDEETHQYVDTETNAKGDTGETPDISIGTVTTVEPGTPAAASMGGTPEAPVLNLSIPKGAVGATPNFTVGTVTTGAPGSQVVVTITGTPEAPVLNVTIPQGMQGNTGSSVDYPYELVNNLTTDDATKGLTAAQGKVLDGKVSQLEAEVTELAGNDVVLVNEVLPQNTTLTKAIVTNAGDNLHLNFSGATAGNSVIIKLRDANNVDQALFDGTITSGQESYSNDFTVIRDNVSIILRTSAVALDVNLVKKVDGGVRQLTEDVSDLQEKAADLELDVDSIKGETKIPVLYNDGYVTTNYPVGTTIDISTYTQNSSYRCLFMGCNPGDVVSLKGQGGASPRLWAFLSADYKIVEVSSEINSVTEINLLAPAGSAFVLINDRSGNDSFVLPSNSIDGLLEQGELEKSALNNAIGYPGLTEILKEIIPYNTVQNIPYEISKDDVIVCRYKYASIGSSLTIKMRDANNADQAIFDGTVASSEGTIIVYAVRDAEKFVILSSNGKGTFVELYKGGDAAVAGLDTIEQTTTSTEDGGVNVITATLKDGTTENFYIRNGRTGGVGPQGIQGPQGNPASTQDYPFQLENTFNGGVDKALTAEKGKDLYEALAPIRGSQIVNVLDRGAVRNGDISSILTAIIASFGEDGGVIYVPRGTYYLSAPVLWVSNVHIYGDGAGQTIIKPTYSNAFGSPTNTNLENISFRDFTVDGELVPNTSGKAFFFLYVKDAIFKDLEILNTPETGLGVDMFINGVIDNVRCDNCGRSGDLSGNAFGCSGIGIGTGAYERGNESLTISNCHCNNCKQNGIFVERQSGDNPVGTSIIGCTCEGNRNGFGISGCDNVALVGCTAFNNHHAGFSYDSGTMHNNTPYGIRPKFIACIAKDNGQNIPSGYPLYDNEVNGMGWFIKSNYKGIELVACSSINNLLHGIYSPAGSYGLSVIGGNFEYNGGDGIHLSAPQRFRIEPTLVQYNTGNGLYVTGSASYGFFKNFMVLDNTGKGIFFDSVTRWQVTVGDYIAAGNAGGNTDGV